MKKIISFLFAVALCVSFVLPAFAYENLVDDSANLFSQQEISEITELADEFFDETGFSLAVATSDEYTVTDSEAFAAESHEALVYYQGWNEDSVYILIDIYNRTVSVSAIGSAGDLYGSYEIDTIIDSGFSELSSGSYAEAVELMIDTAIELYNSDNFYGGFFEDENDNYEEHEYNGYESDYGSSNSFDFSDVLIYIVIGLVIGAISVLVVKSRYKNQGKGDEFDTDDVILNLTGSNDTVISRNVVTTKIPKNNNHSRPGGHGGGGASVHRSSGGRTHSVGSRKF